MTKITIDLGDEYAFETKVNGIAIRYDPKSMHNDYLIAFLEKGMQRFANDKYSGSELTEKVVLCQLFAASANGGEAMPEAERRASRAAVPDHVTLAMRNAKADLTIAFKKITGLAKMVAMCGASEKVAAYFNVKDDVATWNDDAVSAWMTAQKEAGKHDYIEEAKSKLAIDIDI